MPRKQKEPTAKSALKVEPILRHWVEIRDLQNNSTRALSRSKKSDGYWPKWAANPGEARKLFRFKGADRALC